MAKRGPSPEARAKGRAARAAAIAATPSMTRPGSERTGLRVGDKVSAVRSVPSRGTWVGHNGRKGWVAAVNRQRFPSGVTYVEVGVTWQAPSKGHPATDVWFRADELEPVDG